MGINRKFSDDFKLSVVESFVSGSCTQYFLCKKYSLSRTLIRNWVRIFAPDYKPELVASSMGKKVLSESEEILSLKRALREKTLELKREKMRGDFYETMVDVAEEQFNIAIRKKAGAKQ